ncbi:MAG: sugar kinase [Treponema sp.]|nr:sugar kinase [Treponema sp.]
MAKVVTFGEIMLRIQPADYYRFVQVDSMTTTFGGGEANVAVSLANYGLDAYYVTKLPAHEIGQAAVNSLRRYGVHTDYIVRGGDRVGVYYNERGASQRASKCIYDRAGSAIQTANPEEFDWKAILDGAAWFHITGITPALGPNMVQACIDGARVAHELGAKVSCDLNYRGKLWTREQARAAMAKICAYVDVCISNEDDADDVFGIEAESTDTAKGLLSNEGYKSVARQLKALFPNFEKVAITLRSSFNANRNDWQAMLYDGTDFCFSKKYELWIVDRVGGGDSFSAGLIYAMLNGMDTQSALDWAVAASALKHSVIGDYNMVSADEVSKLAGGDGSGRIQR